MRLTREQRDRVDRVVEVLLDTPSDRREGVLATLCPGSDEEELRAEVRRLLSEDQEFSLKISNFSAPEPPPSNTTVGTAEPVAVAERVSPPLPSELPAVIGRYHLRARLGDGGMGEVFLAEQRAPIQRMVALKLIKPGFDSREWIARFEAERQSLARMDHPNIAKVFDAGMTPGGRPYFVMEYVPGAPITSFADEQRLTLRQRLELFLQVCDAIAHAHTKGIIHRDLKPSNILAWMQEGRACVKVIDFGVAKAQRPGRTRGATVHTQLGIVIGTYEYMSPEQAAGSNDIDTRSDVYSLGVLLYELLTGTRPFERSELAQQADEELRRVIREQEPPRPSRRVAKLTDGTRSYDIDRIARHRQTETESLTRILRRELEWIPLKALRKEPERRYSSPADLAADVRNYLEGKALRAGPESRGYVVRKFVQRYRGPIAAAVVVALALVAGVVGTSTGLMREARARRVAEANEHRASFAAYRAALATADIALRNADGVRLAAALADTPTGLRGWEWQVLRTGSLVPGQRLLAKPGEQFVNTIPLADSRRALSATGPGADGGTVVLWDLVSGTVLRREPGSSVAADVAGRRMAVVRPDGSLELLDIETGGRIWRAAPAASQGRWELHPSAFSMDGTLLGVWDGASEHIAVFETASGAARFLRGGEQLNGFRGFVDDPEFPAATGQMLVSVMQKGPIYMSPSTGVLQPVPGVYAVLNRQPVGRDPARWDAVDQEIRHGSLALMSRRGLLFGTLPDGGLLMQRLERTGGMLGRQERQRQRINVGETVAKVIASTPDESRLLVTFVDGRVEAIPVAESSQMRVLGDCRRMELSPDGRRLVTLGWGGIQCYEPLTGLALWGRNLGPLPNRCAAWSPDGKLLVVASNPSDTGAKRSDFFALDAATGEQLAAFSDSPVTMDPARPLMGPAWGGAIAAVAFTPDSSRLLVSREDGSVVVVDPQRWEPVGELLPPMPASANLPRVHTRSMGEMRFSPTGDRLALLTTTSASVVIVSPQGKERTDASLAGYLPTSISWSRSGQWLAIGYAKPGESVIRVVDGRTGAERFCTRTTDGSPLIATLFTPDDSRVVALSETRQMIVLEAETGERVLTTTQEFDVRDACFTPDAALIVASGAFAAIRIDARDPELSLAAALEGWPVNVPRPASVGEARRWVGKADALRLATDLCEPLPKADALSESAAVKAMLELYRTRRPPSINILNSGALSRMWKPVPTAAELAEARQMLRRAVELKPTSAWLQENYGGLLFTLKEYDACREPLRASMRIRAERSMPPSPSVPLQLALAAHELREAAAMRMYRQALDDAKRMGALEDPEVRPLVARGRAAFGE